jgi:hypothetical protein
LLFELVTAVAALPLLDRMTALTIPFGVVIGDRDDDADAWATNAKTLLDGGARILGGGPGVTTAHLAALRTLLRGGVKPSMWPRAL